ncbi:MAG: hypothetical protein V1725_07140 [archaeon]
MKSFIFLILLLFIASACVVQETPPYGPGPQDTIPVEKPAPPVHEQPNVTDALDVDSVFGDGDGIQPPVLG